MRSHKQHAHSSFILARFILANFLALTLAFSFIAPAFAQDETAKVAGKLQGFDAYMEKVLKDWNGPGIGVGIVVNDKLVFAKGYGYRDYEKKLPITSQTLFPIASNTKLFTAVAAGLLVEEGKLTWNRPIRESVPTIEFYNAEALMKRLAGTYETPNGAKIQVVVKPGVGLVIAFPGAPDQKLLPYKGLKFRVPEFADVLFEFVEENGQIKALKEIDPTGEYTFKRL